MEKPKVETDFIMAEMKGGDFKMDMSAFCRSIPALTEDNGENPYAGETIEDHLKRMMIRTFEEDRVKEEKRLKSQSQKKVRDVRKSKKESKNDQSI